MAPSAKSGPRQAADRPLGCARCAPVNEHVSPSPT